MLFRLSRRAISALLCGSLCYSACGVCVCVCLTGNSYRFPYLLCDTKQKPFLFSLLPIFYYVFHIGLGWGAGSRRGRLWDINRSYRRETGFSFVGVAGKRVGHFWVEVSTSEKARIRGSRDTQRYRRRVAYTDCVKWVSQTLTWRAHQVFSIFFTFRNKTNKHKADVRDRVKKIKYKLCVFLRSCDGCLTVDKFFFIV